MLSWDKISSSFYDSDKGWAPETPSKVVGQVWQGPFQKAFAFFPSCSSFSDVSGIGSLPNVNRDEAFIHDGGLKVPMSMALRSLIGQLGGLKSALEQIGETVGQKPFTVIITRAKIGETLFDLEVSPSGEVLVIEEIDQPESRAIGPLSMEDRRDIAASESTPPRLLWQAIKDPSAVVRKTLAARSHVPLGLLARLIEEEQDEDVLKVAISNPAIAWPDICASLSLGSSGQSFVDKVISVLSPNPPHGEALTALLHRKDMPDEVLEAIFSGDPNDYLLAGALSRQTLSGHFRLASRVLWGVNACRSLASRRDLSLVEMLSLLGPEYIDKISRTSNDGVYGISEDDLAAAQKARGGNEGFDDLLWSLWYQADTKAAYKVARIALCESGRNILLLRILADSRKKAINEGDARLSEDQEAEIDRDLLRLDHSLFLEIMATTRRPLTKEFFQSALEKDDPDVLQAILSRPDVEASFAKYLTQHQVDEVRWAAMKALGVTTLRPVLIEQGDAAAALKALGVPGAIATRLLLEIKKKLPAGVTELDLKTFDDVAWLVDFGVVMTAIRNGSAGGDVGEKQADIDHLNLVNTWVQKTYESDGMRQAFAAVAKSGMAERFGRMLLAIPPQKRLRIMENASGAADVSDTLDMYFGPRDWRSEDGRAWSQYMLDYIKEAGGKQIAGLGVFHDFLSRVSRRMKQPNVPLLVESRFLLDSLEGYVFDSSAGPLMVNFPQSGHDLIDYGEILGICVGNGSYAKSANDGKIVLIGLRNAVTGRHYGMVEVALPSFRLVQAKTNQNAILPSDVQQEVKRVLDVLKKQRRVAKEGPATDAQKSDRQSA